MHAATDDRAGEGGGAIEQGDFQRERKRCFGKTRGGGGGERLIRNKGSCEGTKRRNSMASFGPLQFRDVTISSRKFKEKNRPAREREREREIC